MRRRLTILLALVLVVVVTGIALTWIPSNYYLILPDKARPTDPLVKIPGEKAGQSNEIYMVDVRVGRVARQPRRSLAAGIHEEVRIPGRGIQHPLVWQASATASRAPS